MKTINDCFPFVGPFHGSNGFLTSHAAFTLELEQSLQTIDPRLTQPYWDFTFDAGFYGDEWWTKSDVVSSCGDGCYEDIPVLAVFGLRLF